MNKLSLGSVQFGLNYGIANQSGKAKPSEVKKILQLAKNSNVDLIDTAISYGDCEKIIGDIGIKGFKFVTKLPDLHKDCVDIESWVEGKVKSSLRHLGIQSLYGLLIHSSDNHLNNSGKKLINALNRMKLDGLVKKIGVSIYDPNECEQVMKLTRFDIVQAPLNIIDRRLIVSGWFSKLHSEEIEIHTRSVFLQGLLLMPRNKIPSKFNKWSNIWNQWANKLEKDNLDAVSVCLSYPLSLKGVSRVIVGVDNLKQFKNIILASKEKNKIEDLSFMISNDVKLINPFNWKTL